MALINVAINFGYEYFCFVIYFSEFFFVKTFFQNLFFTIFQNFPKFFPHNFVSKIFFPTFFQNFFLRALFAMPPRLQGQNGLYVSVL